ncbi:MAG: ATP-binding protein [Planctomycetota bacterium]
MKNQRTQEESPSDLRRALDVAEARFRAIVERSADGVIVVGTDGVIQFVNPAAETLLGFSSAELLGEVFGIPIVPGQVTEIDVLHRGSATRVAEMRVVESEWQDRRAYLATLRDVTERKRREGECQEAVRRRDQFLAMLSHELRNPLAAIVNAAGVLHRTDTSDPAWSQAKGVIERESRQMTRLLDDLLDVCRISRGKSVLRKEILDLTKLVAEAAQITAPLMDERRIAFHITLPDRPLWIDADPVRMQQVIANLLTNAAKYTEPGGEVWLSLRREGSRARIVVRDTGVGIAPDILPKIFDPFFQGNASLSRSGEGLGIGLSLVQSLVESHGGTVEVNSDGPGKGSSFTVCLLLSDAEPLPPEEPTAQPQTLVAGDLRILIVEDNENAREMLKSLLELDGYDVETADGGYRGLELIEFQKPDVALVDIGLPELDGYQVARRVRANPANEDVFLVALTGYGQPSDRRRAIESGFDAHLVKPLDPERLARLLASRAKLRDTVAAEGAATKVGEAPNVEEGKSDSSNGRVCAAPRATRPD